MGRWSSFVLSAVVLLRIIGVADPSVAQHEAIVAIGAAVRRQALTMGFSDAFAVIGTMLAIAAVAILFARKVIAGSEAGAH